MFSYYLTEKIRLGVSCESSARHVKYQALISLKKNISRKRSAAVVISALKVNEN